MRFTFETTPRGGRAPRADRRICMKNILSQSKTVLRARPDVPRDACRHPLRMNEVDGMAQGTVKCFNSEKASVSSLRTVAQKMCSSTTRKFGYKSLEENQRVKFDVE